MKQANILNMYIYIYIYICCRVKTWSKICLFLSQNLVQVFSFFSFFVFQKSSSFCRENEILKKTSKKKTKKTPFLESKPGPIMLRNILGPGFDSTLGPGFDSTIFVIFGFFHILKCTKTTIFIVFSEKKRKF